MCSNVCMCACLCVYVCALRSQRSFACTLFECSARIDLHLSACMQTRRSYCTLWPGKNQHTSMRSRARIIKYSNKAKAVAAGGEPFGRICTPARHGWPRQRQSGTHTHTQSRAKDSKPDLHTIVARRRPKTVVAVVVVVIAHMCAPRTWPNPGRGVCATDFGWGRSMTICERI